MFMWRENNNKQRRMMNDEEIKASAKRLCKIRGQNASGDIIPEIMAVRRELDRTEILEAMYGESWNNAQLSAFIDRFSERIIALEQQSRKKVAPPAPAVVDDEILTVEEVAKMLKTCTRTVTSYVNRGLLREIKLSQRCLRYRMSHVNAFIEALSSTKENNE